MVLEHPLLRFETRDQVIVPLGENNTITFQHAAQTLHGAAGLMLSLLSSTVEPEKETTLAVQLPEGLTLDELGAQVGRLQSTLSKLVGLPVGDAAEVVEPLGFIGFDVGSSWFTLDAHTVETLALIGWW